MGAPPPPRRPMPYEKQTNYHWRTACIVRENLMDAYDTIYGLHERLRRGEHIGENDTNATLLGMADLLCCGKCGIIIPRLDSSAFVARCGHVYHKSPEGCWEKAGRNCCVARCCAPVSRSRIDRVMREGVDSNRRNTAEQTD